MLLMRDDYCRVITASDVDKKAALHALMLVNIERPIAEELLKEQRLEVRKYKSEKPGMSECAVVMSSKRVIWNIPHKILEAVSK